MGKRQQRAMELMKRMLVLDAEAEKIRAETANIQAELDELIPDDDPPARVRTAPTADRNAEIASSNNGGNGSVDWDQRGVLSAAIREAFRAHRGEWTSREIAEIANVPAERFGSVKAAISRMIDRNEIEKGSKEGTYRAKSA
jgi:hypothetical protein